MKRTMLKTFFIGLILSAIVFSLLYLCSNYVLDSVVVSTPYLYLAEKKDIDKFQQYVTANNISAGDIDSLREWTRKENPRILTVSRERYLLYDNSYSGTIPLRDTRARQLHQTAMFFYHVDFADGPADVFIYNNYDRPLYLITYAVCALIAVLVWIAVFLSMTKRYVNYILLLNSEVYDMEHGTLQNGFTELGKDELTSLASALNSMRAGLKEKEESERRLRKEETEFVTGMAHDLRTSLTALMGSLELIQKNPADAPKYVRRALGRVEQIRALSGKLFTYTLANISDGGEMEPPSYAQIILGEQLSELCACLIQEGFEVQHDLLIWRDDIMISVNTEFMCRIFDNILSNMLKYANRKKPVEFSTYYPEEALEICVRIKNQKTAIPEQIQGNRIGVKNIFQMMNRMNGRCEIHEDENEYMLSLYWKNCKEETDGFKG